MKNSAFFLSCILYFVSFKTCADDSFFQSNFQPKLSARLISEIDFNDNYRSTNREDEFSNAKEVTRFLPRFDFTKTLSIRAQFVLDQFNKASQTARRNAFPAGGGDHTFEDEGIFTQELNLTYDSQKFALTAGKFNPNYGLAWRWDRGLWGYNLASRYRLTEKLGFSGTYRLGDRKKTGGYDFTFATFTNDRNKLDNAIITGRDSASKSDAVPGDTSYFRSFLAALDVRFDFGKKFGQDELLHYHFAYLDLPVNKRASLIVPSKIADQKSYVASIKYILPIVQNFTLDALLEYERTKNLSGNSDIGENYFTASLIGKIYRNWNVTLVSAKRNNSQINATGINQNLTEFSFGYDFDKNKFFDRLTLQLGYTNLCNNYKTSLETQNVWGAMVRYYKDF